MPVVINGSTGISGNNGTAAVPTIQGTDTNTGMFFPAADQIAFAEGGVEAMRLDASGNVGIGTTTPGERLNVNSGSNEYAIQWNGTGSNNWVLASASNRAYIANKSTSTQVLAVLNGGDFQFNSGYGSVATAFGCRAWVNFNGTGAVAIRSSGNVSSITDNGTGDYTVNFTNAMPDANYAVVTGSATNSDPGGGGGWNMVTRSPSTNTTAGTRLLAGVQNTLYDVFVAHVAIFR